MGAGNTLEGVGPQGRDVAADGRGGTKAGDNNFASHVETLYWLGAKRLAMLARDPSIGPRHQGCGIRIESKIWGSVTKPVKRIGWHVPANR
ncbi:hypothetical protein GCM10009715_26590 [Paeniglutamicibacter psychrophenolicus]